ncbi:MAG: CsgG/HfaB family protein, partial [Holophagales bacterium]|nr:CsgG/HfaB family protein [Holophagales bacterium]
MKRIVSLMLLALVAVLFAAPAWSSDKPRIAVLEFENKADNQYWWRGGAAAIQDVAVTELVKSGKFRVIDRERLDALMREKNLSLSGSVDPGTAIRAGKLLGVEYFLVGSVTEYGIEEAGGSGFGVSVKRKKFTAAANARIIDTETGEILWADEARAEEKSGKVRVFGVGGGVDDRRMFDKVMKPVVQQLISSVKAA